MCAPGGTVYQPVTVVTPQGQVVTQTISPGTIRIQNTQVNSDAVSQAQHMSDFPHEHLHQTSL